MIKAVILDADTLRKSFIYWTCYKFIANVAGRRFGNGSQKHDSGNVFSYCRVPGGQAYLIIVTTLTTWGGVPFSSRRTFFHRKRERDCFLGKFIQRLKTQMCTFFVMEELDKPSRILNVRNTTSQCHSHQVRQTKTKYPNQNTKYAKQDTKYAKQNTKYAKQNTKYAKQNTKYTKQNTKYVIFS